MHNIYPCKHKDTDEEESDQEDTEDSIGNTAESHTENAEDSGTDWIVQPGMLTEGQVMGCFF